MVQMYRFVLTLISDKLNRLPPPSWGTRENHQMKLKMRSYKNEDDNKRIRDFLGEVFLLNNRRMLSWPVARWDYWRWHGIMNLGDGTLESDVYLWETPDGQIAAMLNREGAGRT